MIQLLDHYKTPHQLKPFSKTEVSSRIVCACHSIGRIAFVFYRALGIEVTTSKKGLRFTLNDQPIEFVSAAGEESSVTPVNLSASDHEMEDFVQGSA